MSQQIIAVDFHCKYQKVAWLDPPGGEIQEADVRHDSTEAVQEFYAQFESGTMVGMEVSGYSFWFERMIIEMGLDLRVGHPGEVARMRRRRKTTQRRRRVRPRARKPKTHAVTSTYRSTVTSPGWGHT